MTIYGKDFTDVMEKAFNVKEGKLDLPAKELIQDLQASNRKVEDVSDEIINQSICDYCGISDISELEDWVEPAKAKVKQIWTKSDFIAEKMPKAEACKKLLELIKTNKEVQDYFKSIGK